MLSPVLVRAFGRTGTTLLMQLLKTSEEVLVPNGYPFESRFLTYFARLAAQPLKDIKASDEFSYNDGNVLDVNQNVLGPLPYETGELLDRGRFQRRMLNAVWNQFSQEVFETSAHQYRFYAEKVALDAAPFVNNNLPSVRNIFVTRDPRGELASIIAFNQKRGFNGFGWQENDTVSTFAERMIESRSRYLREVSKYRDGYKNIIVIRFEDLVSDLEAVSRYLGGFLNVELDYAKIIADSDKYKFHMTSSNIEDSQGKWQRELPEEIVDLFEGRMRAELKLFNYSLY